MCIKKTSTQVLSCFSEKNIREHISRKMKSYATINLIVSEVTHERQVLSLKSWY